MRSAEIDVAVSDNLHEDPTLESLELYCTRMHVLLTADDLLDHLPTVPATALLPQRLILLDTPPSPQHIMEYSMNQGVTPSTGDMFSRCELIRSLVARGLGYFLFIRGTGSSTTCCMPLTSSRPAGMAEPP